MKKKPLKRFKHKRLIVNVSPKKKISEMISAFSGGFINMGETMEAKENLLRTACSAWNIAILPVHLREKALNQAVEAFRKYNPGDEVCDEYQHDLQILIDKKLEMFPSIKTVVVEAAIEPINETQFRILIASTPDPKKLFQNH